MNFKNLCIFDGIVALLFGLPLLLTPEIITGFYTPDGGGYTPVSEGLGRLFGALLTGVGIALFFSRNARPSYGRKGLLILLTVSNSLLMVVHLYLIFSGIESNSGWTSVALAALITIWSGKLLAKEKELVDA